jgi:hypothetical protein
MIVPGTLEVEWCDAASILHVLLDKGLLLGD